MQPIGVYTYNLYITNIDIALKEIYSLSNIRQINVYEQMKHSFSTISFPLLNKSDTNFPNS